ncbi:MAG: hypothetical protein PHC28_08070 [Flavobacterium sp.]|uniref:hypothetical protein n=1 Tax=Flavobacterium sp. TaxID=239 RepID=UPI002607CAAD|nr:hypothetical protein [Flavobacterium sp.]MDD5150427.1 hypothetical protein [Flavobacterium sp.]
MTTTNIKCVFTTMGLLIADISYDAKGSKFTFKNPRIIQQTQEGLGLTHFLTLFNETEITLTKDQLVSNLLTPVDQLMGFYQKEFEQQPEIIVPDSNIIQLS